MRKIDLEAERQYENLKVSGENYPREKQSKYYWAIDPEINQFEAEMILRVAGKDVLEIGCSYGDLSRKLALSAKSVTGIDISDEGIKKANDLAQDAGLTNCTSVVGDAHALSAPDNHYDVCIAISILHHLDFNTAIAEIKRVLKPGGILISKEPLGTNPLFQIYRKLTPAARTADEWPLEYQHLKTLNQNFETRNLKFVGLFSLFSAPFYKFPGGRAIRKVLVRLDTLLARTPIKWFFWLVLVTGKVRK